MASRPVFLAESDDGAYVRTVFVDFEWLPGLALVQRQKSIASLHSAASKMLAVAANAILEISSKSEVELGRALSSFNLTFTTARYQRTICVESAYQGSKVFERGGPYVDLYAALPRDAKKDERLQRSGKLIGFSFFGTQWALEPLTSFYDWLYISALQRHHNLSAQIQGFSAFTDIEFNPSRSVNCQAHSAALFVSLYRRGLVQDTPFTKDRFLKLVHERPHSSTLKNSTELELNLSNKSAT